ncbi:inducible metalloproteinase inhibitor protein-like [Anoplophora glabripennis]|uniref:inducible metalloproteinase inhibitor protein-like n=1 Tax=Anoplophora glabripennis TaxID=217634 RepID=UPI000874356C|nr:inducible metalloproteinase inhibitor protein-like [Anoplophora glabripennis]
MKCWALLILLAYFADASPVHKVRVEHVWMNCTRPHEVFLCGSPCQTECATLGQPCPVMNVKCNNDCFCVKGYARDQHGNCVDIIADCPPIH